MSACWKHVGAVCILCAAVVVLPGCGGGDAGTVEGNVTVNGEIVPHGTVVFYAAEGGDDSVATAKIDKGGFKLVVGRAAPGNDRIKPGKYKVTVTSREKPASLRGPDGGPPVPGPRIVPSQYSDPETTPLTVEITEGDNLVPLRLKQSQEDIERDAAADEKIQLRVTPPEPGEEGAQSAEGDGTSSDATEDSATEDGTTEPAEEQPGEAEATPPPVEDSTEGMDEADAAADAEDDAENAAEDDADRESPEDVAEEASP